jgi:aromatic ring-opening dioxygenase catalytic subunit (LigB family)
MFDLCPRRAGGACRRHGVHVGAALRRRACRLAGNAHPSAMTRIPTVYLPHGGGPWPFVDIGLPRDEHDAMAGYLRSLPAAAGSPRALLVVSAHWEETVPTVQSAPRPDMLYDYYGFPEAAYRVRWEAPGAPELAERVRALLKTGGLASADDPSRGFDHGTFVPLKLAYPDAALPTLQLSLVKGLDPAIHIAVGRALRPLRDEGVFIVGSGMSFHNMQAFFGPAARSLGRPFDEWLSETAVLPPEQRDERLSAWAKAPGARASHPREEHLLPLMVMAGAAGEDVGKITFRGTMFGHPISAVQFG